jgi:hypothetical protein
MAHDKNMCEVTYPSDFILETIMNKFNTRVVLTSKVAQTFVAMKTQMKVVFYVNFLDLAPNMAIVLPPNMVVVLLIHALHLSEMPC